MLLEIILLKRRQYAFYNFNFSGCLKTYEAAHDLCAISCPDGMVIDPLTDQSIEERATRTIPTECHRDGTKEILGLRPYCVL